MANTYKNIVITPNRDTAANVVPEIRFSGGDVSTNTDINLRVYTTQSGTLSFEGTAGQLFSITNDLSNSIFSVNDVSGIPSIDVYANGVIQLAPYGGNVIVFRTADSTVGSGVKLDVNGGVNASAILINGQSILATLSGANAVAVAAFAHANAAFASSNADYAFSNSAHAIANLAFVHANGAFAKANAALANTAGITTAGSIIVSGTITSSAALTETHTNGGFQYKESFSDHVAQSKKSSNTYAYYWRTSDDGTLAGPNLKTIAEWFNNRLIFYTNNSQRMYIDATGNVLIGRSDSTVGNNVNLDVNGGVNASAILINGQSILATLSGANAVAVAAFAHANAAFAFSNSAHAIANLAFVHANAAFTKANAALANTAGITTAGSIIVSGAVTANATITIDPSDGVNEGGQINLLGAGSFDDWSIDSYQNQLRHFTNSPNTNTFWINNIGAGTVNFEIDGHAIAAQMNLVPTIQAAFTAANTASPLGQQTIWVPAGAMTSRLTNGAVSGTTETVTNRVMFRTLDFDTTTQEFAQFAIQMPKSWNESTLLCQFVWSHPTTTTNFGVVWQIQAVALADTNAGDTAFGTAVTATDTGGTANAVYISPETSAMTVGNTPGAEEWVVFQVARVPANASDTLAVDARLHGVRIHYTIDAAKDD